MNSGVELVSDGHGLTVIGAKDDVELFVQSEGLDRLPSRTLNMQKLRTASGLASSAMQLGGELAANSGRWVKLTSESAAAVKKYGLMPTKTPGVSHAMIGNPGDIKQWLQIAKAPTAVLSGPFALTALSSMMQQQAMQQQMDEIVDYLQALNEKVDDILHAQKDAMLSPMVGVRLTIEEAMAVREQVGAVSDVTWSKVQGGVQTVATTQAYALKRLDAVAGKLRKKAQIGEIAAATREAEPQVREWLAVLAQTVQLQDAMWVIELDRVLDASPAELENHRLGLITARERRMQLIDSSITQLLTQMQDTVNRANSKVLFNPFDSPAAVRSCNNVSSGLVEFRSKLSIEANHEAAEAKRWRQAASEVRDRVADGAKGGAMAAGRVGGLAISRATEAFREVDLDGDGVPDKARVASIAEDASSAISGVVGGLGSLFRRRRGDDAPTPPGDVKADKPEA